MCEGRERRILGRRVEQEGLRGRVVNLEGFGGAWDGKGLGDSRWGRGEGFGA